MVAHPVVSDSVDRGEKTRLRPAPYSFLFRPRSHRSSRLTSSRSRPTIREMSRELAHIRCHDCSADNPVGAKERAAGWFRCSFCDTPHPMPGLGVDTIEGPESRIIVLRKLGRYHFIFPPRTMLSGRAFLLGMIGIHVVGVSAMASLELVAHQHLPLAAGRVMLLIAVLVAMVRQAERYFAEQHLEVSSRSLHAYWVIGGWYRRRTQRHDFERLDADVIASRRRRADVRLGLSQGLSRSKTLVVHCIGLREAQWFVRLLTDIAESSTSSAVDSEGTSETLSCRGCGAVLDNRVHDRADGAIQCSYCDTTFVYVHRSLVWQPVRMSCAPRSGSQPIDLSAHESDNELILNFRSRSTATRDASASAFASAIVLAFAGKLALITLFRVPEQAWGVEAWLATFGSLALCLSFGALIIALVGWVGVNSIHISPYTMSFEQRLLGRLIRGERLALMRLKEVAFQRMQDLTTLELSTPHRTMQFSWRLPGSEDEWVRREILQRVERNVLALDRKVVASDMQFGSLVSSRWENEGSWSR